MIQPTRSASPIKLSLLLLCMLCALLAPAAARAAAAVHYEKESLQEYEKQLAAGQVKAATFNKKVRSLHLELTDGRHVKVIYGPGGEPALAKALEAKHVPVTIEKAAQANKEAKKAPVKHKLRYIAGGILLLVIVVVGGVLLVDRRRKRAAE